MHTNILSSLDKERIKSSNIGGDPKRTEHREVFSL